MAGESVDLDDAADELYGLHRDAFVPRRTELVKAARAAGDRDTATAVGALRKPSVAAWLANALARDHPDEVGALEDLGASLQDAQARLEGDALRALSRQRHELVAALVARARRIARDDGVTVGDTAMRELERTVTAALADADAARALAAGRLVTALEPGAGLGEDVVATPPPARGAARRRPPPDRARRDADPVDGERAGDDRIGEDRAAEDTARADREREDAARAERERAAREERERLDRAVAEAREAVTAARAAADGAREAAGSAEDAHAAAARTVADLRSRLVDAEDDEARAARDASRAREAHDRRREELDAAERDLDRRERERG